MTHDLPPGAHPAVAGFLRKVRVRARAELDERGARLSSAP